jgi:hypothetical protein
MGNHVSDTKQTIILNLNYPRDKYPRFFRIDSILQGKDKLKFMCGYENNSNVTDRYTFEFKLEEGSILNGEKCPEVNVVEIKKDGSKIVSENVLTYRLELLSRTIPLQYKWILL